MKPSPSANNSSVKQKLLRHVLKFCQEVIFCNETWASESYFLTQQSPVSLVALTFWLLSSTIIALSQENKTNTWIITSNNSNQGPIILVLFFLCIPSLYIYTGNMKAYNIQDSLDQCPMSINVDQYQSKSWHWSKKLFNTDQYCNYDRGSPEC